MTEGNVAINVGDLELAQEATPGPLGEAGDVASLEQAIADFEKALLQRLHRNFPRAAGWRTSNTWHSAMARTACDATAFPEQARWPARAGARSPHPALPGSALRVAGVRRWRKGCPCVA